MAQVENSIKVPSDITLSDSPKIAADLLWDIANREEDEIIVEHEGISLTPPDILPLILEERHVTDNAMNYYLKLIQERNERENLVNMYVFDSSFYDYLHNQKRGPSKAVDKYADRMMFDHPFMLIPVHIDNKEWALVLVDNYEQTIIEYSPSGFEIDGIVYIKYFIELCVDKFKERIRYPYYIMLLAQHIPQQEKDYQCGIYTMLYAECISRCDKNVKIERSMHYNKTKIFLEVLSKRMLKLL